MNTIGRKKTAMNKMIGIIFFLLAANIQAGQTSGTVGGLYVHYYNDRALFRIVSDIPDYAACATSIRYAVETSSPQGKNVFSAILAAKMAGKSIVVNGKGVCDVHGDAETVNYIRVD